ncbi:MAG: hypothetical protein C0179_01500 [Fervidicoccus sp.]|nr:MAG: hypothetical protein C0179_01500 [Fervidicoccus sp.]
MILQVFSIRSSLKIDASPFKARIGTYIILESTCNFMFKRNFYKKAVKFVYIGVLRSDREKLQAL